MWMVLSREDWDKVLSKVGESLVVLGLVCSYGVLESINVASTILPCVSCDLVLTPTSAL